VLEGGRITAGGLRVALADASCVHIGRGEARRRSLGPQGEVSLLVPDPKMSREHARITAQGDRFEIEDAGSTNGTIVDGDPLAPGARRALRDGALLELGQTIFVFRKLEADAAPHAGDLEPEPTTRTGFTTLDPELARRLGLLARVAASPMSILLLGETGTGKEVLARGIHELSQRPGPFVAVNCGAIPPNLVESHLFGHVKGAFSGAVKDEPGMVRSASFGTLLLDEIGDLPISAQAALLRVLQEREVRPVGSAHASKIDVRIVAATHRPLDGLVEKAFRRDLYARLAGYVFSLVPLRERLVDLGLLTASMLASGDLVTRAGLRIHRDALRAMFHHEWPMNVRELSQCLGVASALADDGVITVAELPPALRRHAPPDQDAHAERTLSEEDETLRKELLARFEEANGNVSDVARAMGKARQQIQRWVRRFAIEPERFRRLARLTAPLSVRPEAVGSGASRVLEGAWSVRRGRLQIRTRFQ